MIIEPLQLNPLIKSFMTMKVSNEGKQTFHSNFACLNFYKLYNSSMLERWKIIAEEKILVAYRRLCRHLSANVLTKPYIAFSGLVTFERKTF